ncbi:MAG: hypothetical protein SFX73_14700 [Kofleriaceae bacterium]|nr:hypothetical protein [Kofleriaceae bacterium]
MSFDRVHVRWLLLASAAVVLVVHSLAYNFVTDDAYISFVFSRNLAEHGELSFNLGDPVEGYTNFLWTVILGVGMLLGIPPELSSRVLGTACALGTLYMVFRITTRALGRRSPWAAVPALLLAASSGFACWTSGGLETQLFTLLVTAALDGVVAAADNPRALRRAAIALALSAMTRPEGLLVAGLLGIVHVLGRVLCRRAPGAPRGARHEVIAAACFLGVWAPWFAWRAWYYGHLWPNTYYVKASGRWSNPKYELEMLKNGAHYVWVWATQTRVLYALPLVVVGLTSGAANRARLVLAMACTLLGIAYLSYAITVGGDFMGLHRFVMPVFVVAAIATTLGLECIVGWVARGRAHMPVAIVTTLALVGAFAFTQYKLTRESTRFGNNNPDRGIDTPAYLMVYTEDRAAIGRAMEKCFLPDDFSIVGGAGAQPYLGRMRAIDVFGLVSERIAHEEPRIRPRAGHTKFGNDRLLADYDPDFVFSCYVIHAKPTPQPRLGCGGFWLSRGYEQVTMHIPGMRQQGEYYTFLAKKDRNFQCPGRVP